MKPLILVGNRIKTSRQSVPEQLDGYNPRQDYVEIAQKVERDSLARPAKKQAP